MIESIDSDVIDEHTGSSRYASAESDLDSDVSFGIQRMSLGPAGAALVGDRMDSANGGARSTPVADLQATNTIESGQLQAYFKAAMDKLIRDHERQNASHPIELER